MLYSENDFFLFFTEREKERVYLIFIFHNIRASDYGVSFDYVGDIGSYVMGDVT